MKSLKLSHVQEVKALSSPPAGVKLTMEAVPADRDGREAYEREFMETLRCFT